MSLVEVYLPSSGTVDPNSNPRKWLNHCHLYAYTFEATTMGMKWDVPPENMTPSELTLMVLTIALWPLKLNTKVPSGHFHFLMLLPPAEPEAKEYSVGWMVRARTDFLWCVSVVKVLPAARSHSRIVESILPVITWGSDSWHLTSATVAVWPAKTCIWALVRMSHTRADASRPEVTRTSRVGWRASAYTPERWPW